MALTQHKIPIITGVNDLPSSEGDAHHPNEALLCKAHNDLIDDIPSEIQTVALATVQTEAQTIARQSISVSGDLTYSPTTGVIGYVTPTGGNAITTPHNSTLDGENILRHLLMGNRQWFIYDYDGNQHSGSGEVTGKAWFSLTLSSLTVDGNSYDMTLDANDQATATITTDYGNIVLTYSANFASIEVDISDFANWGGLSNDLIINGYFEYDPQSVAVNVYQQPFTLWFTNSNPPTSISSPY